MLHHLYDCACCMIALISQHSANHIYSRVRYSISCLEDLISIRSTASLSIGRCLCSTEHRRELSFDAAAFRQSEFKKNPSELSVTCRL